MSDLTTLTDPELDAHLLATDKAHEDAVMELRRRYVELRDGEPVEPPVVEPPIVLPPQPDKVLLKADSYQPGWGDVIQHKPDMGPLFQLLDSIVVCGARSGAITHSQAPEGVEVDIRNVDLIQGPVTVGWGLCLNHVYGTIEGVTANGLGLPGPDGELRDGHACYGKLYGGDFAVLDSDFLNCAGQALQLVTRPHEGPVPENLTVILDGITATDCSRQPVGHGGGGSAMLALYCASTGFGTVIHAGSINLIGTIGQPADAKKDHATRGGIQVWADGHADDGGFFDRFTCDDLFIDFQKGDRHPLDFKDTKHVHLGTIDGQLHGAFREVNGVPVLINMEKRPGPGSILVESTTFAFAILLDGVAHNVPAGEGIDLAW